MKKIVFRNIIYAYISFLSSGIQNTVPQFFFGRFYPEEKNLLLPVALIAGAVFSAAGMVLAGKLKKNLNPLFFIMLISSIGGFISMLFSPNKYLFICFLSLSSFSVNFLYNFIDHAFLERTDRPQFNTHVRMILIYQIIGYMVAPLYFAFTIHKLYLSMILPLFLSIFGGWISSFSMKEAPLKTVMQNTEEKNSSKIDIQDLLFIIYTALFMTVIVIAQSTMAYMISDYYKISSYEKKTGIILMLIIFSTAISVLFFTILRKKFLTENQLFKPLPYLLIPLVTICSVLLLLFKFHSSFLYLLFSALPVGLSYGFFLSITRSYAGMASLKGKKSILTIYNNLNAVSAISGYFLVFGSYHLAKLSNRIYLQVILLTMLVLLFLAGLVVLIQFIRNRLLERDQSEEKV